MIDAVAIPVTPEELNKPSADHDSLSRAKQTTPAAMLDSTEDSPERSFSGYGKVPYTVKYLGVEDFYKMDLEGDLKTKVTEVEAYLLEKMNGDNLLFAKAWLDKLTAELNFQEHETPIGKFERLYKYVKAKERLEREARMKQTLKLEIEKALDRHPLGIDLQEK